MPHEADLRAQLNRAVGRAAELRERVAELRSREPLLDETMEELLVALEELSVTEEELRGQNDELASAHQLLDLERSRYADLFHSAPDPYLVTALDGTVREANHAAATLLGVRERDLSGKPLAVFVHRDHVRRFRERLNRLAEAQVDEGWEFDLQPRGAAPVTVTCAVRRAPSPAGGVPLLRWMLHDVTGQRHAEERERALAAQAAAGAAATTARRRLEAVLEATTDAYFSLDAGWRFTYVNRRAEELWAIAREGVLGRTLWEIFPQAEGSTLGRAMRRAMDEGVPVEAEGLSPVLDRWIEVHAFPVEESLSVFFRDVEERRAREEADRVLARAGELLARSLDPRETLRELAALAAEELADWCVVHVQDEGAVHARGVAHADPERAADVRAALRAFAGELREQNPVSTVLRTGEARLIARVTAEELESAYPDAAERETVAALGIASAMVVPMQARGRTLGAVTFARGAGREYTARDLGLASELARRAALAVDNARLYEQSLAAGRAREEVLAVVSHDLRNPLNAVLLASIILDEYSDPDRWSERDRAQLRAIRHSAEQMTALIHDLVEVVSLEAGTRILRREPVDVAVALRSAAEMYAGMAAEKRITLSVHAPDDVPDVTADRGRLLQVISNLLGNALKFTPPDGEVSLGADAHGDGVRIWVADTGKGIDPEHLPRLFDRFWQARRGEGGGMGLGLSIAKAIVDAHGGRIWADSSPGQGTTFSFVLPPPPE